MSDQTNGAATSSAVWLVTGASKGIGKKVVEAALAAGDRVVAGSRDPRALDEWAREQGVHDRLLAVRLDVTSAESAASAVSAAVDRFGRVDVLVNNAGYLLHGGVEEFSDAELRRSFDVNVFGVLTMIRVVLPVMREQRSGRVIDLASISAEVTSPAVGLYSATKAAVLMFSEALAAEAEPLGVFVTAVCPGGVRTDFLDSSSAHRAERTIEAYRSVHETEDSLGRANHNQGGDPTLVARALVTLARMDAPPRRLYLGEDAVRSAIRAKHQQLESIDEHRALSESITAPAAE